MSQETKSATTDLIRWSFAIETDRGPAIQSHLIDLGADVMARDGGDFLVTWDEPDGDLSEVIEAIWAINGQPFELIQEAFHRLELHTFQHVDDEPGTLAA